MHSDIGDQTKVALCSVGIYFVDKKTKQCHQQALEYIKKYEDKIAQDFPIFDQISVLTLKHNNVSYSLKIQLSAPNEYAIINGKGLSAFKVSEKQKSFYKVIWNSILFKVNIIVKSGDNFQVTVNNKFTVNIEKVENYISSGFEIPFESDEDPLVNKHDLILERCLFRLNNILNGFIFPEPFFSLYINKELDLMFNVLKDPLLPSLQFQSLLESIESCVPISLLNELKQIISQYTSNYSSILFRFPSKRIFISINKHVETIDDQITKLNLMTTLRPLLELAEMYSDGVRGNTKQIIENILESFRKVEAKFQNEDKICSRTGFSKRSISVTDLLSHSCITEKSKLILYLIDYIKKYIPGLIFDLKPTITKVLNSLSGKMYYQVISKLKEILISGQKSSYEIRKNEIEAVFLNSINRYSSIQTTSNLENLIYSNTEMFDIISDFFYHKLPDLRKCALEVYIRRAYMSYQIHSFKQSQLSSGHFCVLFQYSRSTTNKDKGFSVPKLKRSNSFVTLNNSPNSNCGIKKYCQSKMTTDKISSFLIDKEDIITEIFNPEVLNEFNLLDEKIFKQRDNDTDSAISVEAHSLSEMSATISDPVDFDSIGESFITQCRFSPSVYSLEEMPTKTSNTSLDSLVTNKWKRNFSIHSNQLPSSYYQDFLGNFDLGIMAIFQTLTDLDKHIDLLNEFISSSEMSNYSEYLDHDLLEPNTMSSFMDKVVVNIVLNDPELFLKPDNDVSQILHKYCVHHSDLLNDRNVSRVTFLLHSMDKNLRYFTFRANNHFEEDLKVRQIDPALAFQLEINRLRNYHLERLPILNRRMFVYLAKLKVMMPTSSSEYRMFLRCIIYQNPLNAPSNIIDYMTKEAEKSLVEAIDALDIVWIDERVNVTTNNHIFFSLHSILYLNKIEELESVVRSIVLKYGQRLWNLRITQAELKLSVKLNDYSSPIPIRLWVHNEGGRSLDIFIYREEYLNNTSQKVLISWSSTKEGRYHGVPVDYFYQI